jgi:hypothetical protein
MPQDPFIREKFTRERTAAKKLAAVSVGRLAWASCIGKAFRIAENRVNRNARNCAPEDRANHPDEIGAKQNIARHRHTPT